MAPRAWAKPQPAEIVHRPLSPDQLEQKNKFSVEAMAAVGAAPASIAEYLGISVADLRKNYGKELKEGHSRVKLRFEIQVAARAQGGDVRCLLAWLKQYGGWTEVTRKEITGANGEPITIRSLDAPSLDQLIIALRQAEASDRRAQGGRSAALGGGSGRIIDLESVSGTTDEGPTE